jgi:hypothetical protein
MQRAQRHDARGACGEGMTRPANMAQAIEWANAADTPAGARWYTSSCGRIELAITLDDADSGGHRGACDDDIAALLHVPYIAEQMDSIPADVAREVATESGRNDYGHGDQDNTDHDANIAFILWCACADILENEG